MVDFEADDALASATARFKSEAEVEQIVICSPDKDLAQLICGNRIVSWDRRRNIFIDEAGVVEKFGVRPPSIPDWLGLVGDAADGFPGIPGWGERSAAAVLAHYERLEAIPADPRAWGLPTISESRATRLAESLTQHWAEALLFRTLATLREDAPLKETLANLEWQGAYERLHEVCHRLGDDKFPGRVPRWRTN